MNQRKSRPKKTQGKTRFFKEKDRPESILTKSKGYKKKCSVDCVTNRLVRYYAFTHKFVTLFYFNK